MVEDICPKCNVLADKHTEESCLRVQLAHAKESMDEWKNAWYDLREVIGRLSWKHNQYVCPHEIQPAPNTKPNSWRHENETIVQEGKLVYVKNGIDWKLVAAGTSEDAAKAVMRLMSDTTCNTKQT